MEKKIEFTQEELQTLYAACIAYRDELHSIIKKLWGCHKAVESLNDLADKCSCLAIKATEYMEDELLS